MTAPDNTNGASAPHGAPTGSDWGKALHRLNNTLASIHSSLDLALAQTEEAQARPFLLLARSSAREAASLVNELRFGGNEQAAQECLGSMAKAVGNGATEASVVPGPRASLEGLGAHPGGRGR